MDLDWTWVDDSLKAAGLRVDFEQAELPLLFQSCDCRSVNSLMRQVVEFSSKSVQEKFGQVKASAKPLPHLDSVVGLMATGSASPVTQALTQHYSLSDPAGEALAFTAEDFMTMTFDTNMIQVGELWDDTFVRAEFTHIFTRDGRGEMAGQHVKDVAKVMTWVFHPYPLAKREMKNLLLIHRNNKQCITAAFPVTEDSNSPAHARTLVKGKLQLPCYDQVCFDADGRVRTFEHVATASLGGWVNTSLMNWLPSTFMKVSSHEAASLWHIVSKKPHDSPIVAGFEKTKQIDGMIV